MMYQVELSVTLEPVWHAEPPEVLLVVDGTERVRTVLDRMQTFNFDYRTTESESSLGIEFLNKTDSDTIVELGLDKAVVIRDVSFFGISDPKFIWTGVYTPIYPTHVIGQPATVDNTTYLGFNGTWRLDFDVPVFTWMHKLLNFGWIYD